MTTIGYHYLVEASGCDPEVLASPERTREALMEAARRGRLESKAAYFYRFSPTGVSGMVVVAESHISIHTWPEEGYAALDVYVCGDDSDPEQAIEQVLQAFGAAHAHVTEVQRGVRDEDVFTHTLLSWDERPERPG